MRTIVTFIFLLIIFYTAESANTRSGSVFQQNAIHYFGLFPHIDSTVSATFEARTGSDSVDIRLRRSSLPDTVLTVHQHTAAIITEYTDHFEEIFIGSYTINWSHLQSLVRPIQPFMQREPIELTTTEGTNISGILFAVTDTVVLVYTGPRPLDWQTYTKEHLLPVPFYTITTIDGRYIGGNKSFYASAKTFLQKRTMFHSMPPEASQILSSPSLIYQVPPQSLQTVELPSAYAKPRWHCAVLLGLNRSNAPVDLFNIIINAAPDTREYSTLDPQKTAIFVIGEASLSYDISDQFHALLAFSTFPSAKADNMFRNSFHQKSVGGWTAQLMGSFSLIQSDAFLDTPFDWQIGAGIAYTEIQVETFIRSTINPETGAKTSTLRDYTYNDTAGGITPCFTSLVRYYISSLLSLQLQASLFTPRGLSVPSYLYPPSQNDNRIGIGRGGISFGVGVNL